LFYKIKTKTKKAYGTKKNSILDNEKIDDEIAKIAMTATVTIFNS
jgi:hypothetical protein